MEVMDTLNGNRIEQLTQRKTILSIYIYNILVNLYQEDIITENEFEALCNNPSLIAEIAKSKKFYNLKGIRYRIVYTVKKYDTERKEIIDEIKNLRLNANEVIASDIEQVNKRIEEFKKDVERYKKMKRKPSLKANEDLHDMLIEKAEIDIRIAEEEIKIIKLNASDIISDDIYEIANTSSHRGVEYEKRIQNIYDRIAYEAQDLEYHKNYIHDILVLRDTYDKSKFEKKDNVEDAKLSEEIPEPEVVETSEEIVQTEPEATKSNVEIATVEPEVIETNEEIVQTDSEATKSNVEMATVEPEVIETNEEIVQIEPEATKSNVEIATVEPEAKEKSEKLIVIKREKKIEKPMVQEQKQEKDKKEEKREIKIERKKVGGVNMDNKKLESVSKEYNNAKNIIRNILMYKSIIGKNTPGLGDDDIKRYIASYEDTINDFRKNGNLSDSELHRIYTELENEVDSNEYKYTKDEIIQDMPIYSKEEQIFNTKGMTEEEIINSQNKINNITVNNTEKSDNESSFTQSSEKAQTLKQTSTEETDDIDEQIEETKRKLEELENKKKAKVKTAPVVTPPVSKPESKTTNEETTTEEETNEEVKDITDPLELMQIIAKMNKDAKIMIDPKNGMFDRIYSSVPAENLKLPEPFYYNEKNGITNKHKTKNGQYLTIQVDELTEELEPSLALLNGDETDIKSYLEYDEDLDDDQKKNPKEGWFKRNWKKFTKKVKDNWKAITAWGVSLTVLSLLGYGTYKYIKDKEIESEKNKVDDTTKIEETVKPENTEKQEEKTNETATQSHEQTSNKDASTVSTSEDKTNEEVVVPADPEVEEEPSNVPNRPENENVDESTTLEKKTTETVSSNNGNSHYDYTNNVYHYNTNESEIYYSAYGAHEDGKVELNQGEDTSYTAYGAHKTNPYNESSNQSTSSSSSEETSQQEENNSNMNSESAEALAYYEEQMSANETIHYNSSASYPKAKSIFAEKIEHIRKTNGSDQAYVEQVVNEIYEKLKNPGTASAEELVYISTDGITASKYYIKDGGSYSHLFDSSAKGYMDDIKGARSYKLL